MSIIRFNAVSKALDNSAVEFENSEKFSSIYASNVFNDLAKRQFLDQQSFTELKTTIFKNNKLSKSLATSISSAIKDWALSKGVTHFTHWFKPLSGKTAEKQDAFFTPLKEGYAIEQFSVEELFQKEPDESELSPVGIRNTFEARGFTSWDITSPPFIFKNTLYIPTVFISYSGASLDYKTPLLKAVNSLDKAATEICKYFDKNVKKVYTSLGWEQEFYLLDSSLAASRPDLMLTGRTLLGNKITKGVDLDQHIQNNISNRSISFLKELEYESLLLGIPIKTKHNEVEPNQFEIAPLYQSVNISVDHNILLMDIMKQIAEKHNFKVLFHEKPFSGLSGSSKHLSWSLSNDSDVNLFSPGKTPMSNLLFLTFFINTVKAINEYEVLVRSTIASNSNDYRLGEEGAPQTIMSIYIGDQLTKVLNELENVTEGKLSPSEKTELKLNVLGRIPTVLLDNTDENRTSPIAFTGSKFEFRGVGAKSNCAKPMIVFNTILANQLVKFKAEVDALIDKKDMKKDDAIFNIVREYIKDSKNILFEGNCYDSSWVKEAKKRGLSNIKSTTEALKEKISKQTISLFENLGVMDRVELESRYNIELKEYISRVKIESKVLGDIARNHVIPTAIKYQNILIENVKGLKEIYGSNFMNYAKEQLKLVEDISNNIGEINSKVTKMINQRQSSNLEEDLTLKAKKYCDEIKPMFEDIRRHCDNLELLIDNELWPLTKYRELLFSR